MEKTAEIFVKAARLQSEFWDERFFGFTRNMLRTSPECFEPFFVSPIKNSTQFPPNFPHRISAQEIEKNSPTSFCRSAGRKSMLANADGQDGQPRSRLRDIIWKQGSHPPALANPPPLANFHPKPVLGDYLVSWETDFYIPPVLGGAALLPFSAPAVYKNPVP